MVDQKYKPIKYGRCVVEIEDSYANRGRFVLKCWTESQKGPNPLLFDDQIDDMIRAFKLARRFVFRRRLFRIFFGH